jgi:heat shock protein HtpX
MEREEKSINMHNALKTTILLGLMTGLVVAAGYGIAGQDGMWFALIFAAIMNFGAYWFSDKFALAAYHARELEEKEAPGVHAIVADLAQRAGIPKPRVFLTDLPVPNAFATGRNPNKAVVAVTRGLLQALDERQLRAVIAHELGHIKNRDILLSSIAATLAGAISSLAQMAMWSGALFGGSRDREGGNVIGMLVMIILTPIVASMIHMAVSRSREFHADETGAKITGAPQDLASALRVLEAYATRHPLHGQPKHEATAHLFIVNPFAPSLLARLFSTHPSTEERVAKLMAMNPSIH